MTEKIDYNGMVSLFATPVFLSHITDEKIIDDATDNILKLKEKTPGVQRYGGWVTDDNLQKLPTENMHILTLFTQVYYI